MDSCTHGRTQTGRPLRHRGPPHIVAPMCGRYVLTTPGEVLAQIFETAPPPEATIEAIVPRYNISPTQTVPIVRRSTASAATRELALVQWGLVPHWAKDPAIGNSLINARSETAAEKPSFRDALKRRRCLIPADAFYEWQKLGKGKQPWLLRMRGAHPFAFAGLWSQWKNPESGAILETCAILTTSPNELAATVHDRMPVILPATTWPHWLDDAAPGTPFSEFFVSFPAAQMEAFPVSKRVNSPANEGPENIVPIQLEATVEN
jgi:putative SOS response-associated peptidase YedK